MNVFKGVEREIRDRYSERVKERRKQTFMLSGVSPCPVVDATSRTSVSLGKLTCAYEREI